MDLDRDVNGFRIVDFTDGNDLNVIKAVASLYCDIWREPPWNEGYWTVETVVDDIMKQCQKLNSIFKAVINGTGVVGFSWGYEMNFYEIETACPGLIDFLTPGGKIFYIDELGVAAKKREKGIGSFLSSELLSVVKERGFSDVFLRTHVEAVRARKVYTKLGFEDSLLIDKSYDKRTYWFLKL